MRTLIVILAGVVMIAALASTTMGIRRASDHFTCVSLAEAAADKYGSGGYEERDAYRMPDGTYCVQFWPPKKIGSLEVLLSRNGDGQWNVTRVLKDAQPVDLRSSN
jgi:hypothetical protein